MDTSDALDTPIPYALPDEPPQPPPLPRTAVDWGRTHVTPGLVQAMARAQAAAETVGKGGRNADKGYDYATGDSMLAELRRCISVANAQAGSGHLWVTFAHRAVDSGRGAPDPTAGQWVDALIVTECVVFHAAEDGTVGQWVATAECEAVCSKARPADKAARAAETYRAGFIARDLLCLDRGKVAAAEDVDQRADEGTAVQGRRSTGKQAAADASIENELRDSCSKMVRAVQESKVAAGEPRPTAPEVIAALMGDGWRATTLEDWRAFQSALSTAVAQRHAAATKGRRTSSKRGEEPVDESTPSRIEAPIGS